MNLLRVEDLSVQEIQELLTTAQKYKDQKIRLIYPNKIVANMFFEPSTRTQNSFHVAEHKLGCKVINFNTNASSMSKGESFYDTVKTIDSLGVDVIVIRSAQNQ
jgi:aspartate carbamoyltransferase catalytic subunit